METNENRQLDTNVITEPVVGQDAGTTLLKVVAEVIQPLDATAESSEPVRTRSEDE